MNNFLRHVLDDYLYYSLCEASGDNLECTDIVKDMGDSGDKTVRACTIAAAMGIKGPCEHKKQNDSIWEKLLFEALSTSTDI